MLCISTIAARQSITDMCLMYKVANSVVCGCQWSRVHALTSVYHIASLNCVRKLWSSDGNSFHGASFVQYAWPIRCSIRRVDWLNASHHSDSIYASSAVTSTFRWCQYSVFCPHQNTISFDELRPDTLRVIKQRSRRVYNAHKRVLSIDLERDEVLLRIPSSGEDKNLCYEYHCCCRCRVFLCGS